MWNSQENTCLGIGDLVFCLLSHYLSVALGGNLLLEVSSLRHQSLNIVVFQHQGALFMRSILCVRSQSAFLQSPECLPYTFRKWQIGDREYLPETLTTSTAGHSNF